MGSGGRNDRRPIRAADRMNESIDEAVSTTSTTGRG